MILIATSILMLGITMLLHTIMYLLVGITSNSNSSSIALPTAIDTSWYPPLNTSVSWLPSAINGTGTYGFIFNSSQTPVGVGYGTYNWCNMPHVRRQEYERPPAAYRLKYVEVIHRHHKRTPYAANCFPVEPEHWSCADEGLFYYAEPLNEGRPVAVNRSAPTYWSVFKDAQNPFSSMAGGFPGDCEFPQITRGGLDDAWQHGRDLFGVYRDLLGLIPDAQDEGTAPQGTFSCQCLYPVTSLCFRSGFGLAVPCLPSALSRMCLTLSLTTLAGVSFRVTNNVITSQVASMVLNGMFNMSSASSPIPLLVQPSTIDSLEPTYSCPAAASLQDTYGPGSTNPTWQAHLSESAPLYSALDRISGVSPSASDWHVSWDHYFDNLSARLCHSKPLPCNASDPTLCVTEAMANEVFRLGEWEYSWM